MSKEEIFESLFGGRLKEARKELRLNQAEAAELTGVTREHWGRCERGAAVPGGEVLAALAKAGADVHYVLTGERERASPLVLSPEEQTMLGYFRDASKEVRRAALGALLGASGQVTARASGSGQNNVGDNAIQIGSVTGNARIKNR